MRAQHTLAAIAVLSMSVVMGAACNQTPIITPVRSLDRPSDVALTCTIYRPSQVLDPSGKSHETGLYEARPLSSCGPLESYQQEQLPNPENPAQIFTPQLRALIASSARGEVAAVDVPNEILIDQDLANPGYNFIPVGRLPQGIRASADGCMAVTANADSCDLSIVDTTILYNMSFEEGPAHRVQRPRWCGRRGHDQRGRRRPARDRPARRARLCGERLARGPAVGW